MLNFLRVKNLAIVENALVTFSPTLNIITGETGSGKSVFIGALNLILGERADHGAVRTGEKELSVEASFTLKDTSNVDAVLENAGIEPCADGELVIRRVVSASGSGRCWINDTASTVTTLKRLGEYLVDMHGPYDHQSLLSPEYQLSLLDSFGKTDAPKSAYQSDYKEYMALLKEREELLSESEQGILEEIDRLTYIVQEIESAALTEEDGDDLIQRHKEACNGASILEMGSEITSALTDGEISAFDTLATVQHRLADLGRIFPEAEDWHEEASSIAISIQELSRTISERMLRVDTDPEALANLEARMDLVQRLKRKYGPTLENVVLRRDAAKEKLERLLTREKRLNSLDGEIAASLTKLRKSGKTLTEARDRAGKALAKEITQELQPLGFKQSYFEVIIKPHDPASSGMDEACFSFAPNPGEAPMSLRSIASSGEIARVMLATKSVLAAHDSIPLLVFDEIDSNVGGEIGSAVGEKLHALSESHQVISITHLPQVAAYGDKHLSVSKKVVDNRTQAEIAELEGETRAKEIARMLGGSDITSVVLAHAKELIEKRSRLF